MANIKEVTIAVSSVGTPVLRAEWRKHDRGTESTLSRTFALSQNLGFLPALRSDGKGGYQLMDLSDVQVYSKGREDHFFAVEGLGYILENIVKTGPTGVQSNTVLVYLPFRLEKNKMLCKDVTMQLDMATKKRLASMCEAYTAALA